MTYTEFYKDYPYIRKQFPGVSSIICDFDRECITEKQEVFHKIGTKWKLAETKEEKITGQYYFNVLESVPFFKRMSYERVTCGYTQRGYIPTEIVSISPDKTIRIRRSYEF